MTVLTVDTKLYWAYLEVYIGESFFAWREEEWFSAWKEVEFVCSEVRECCDEVEFPVREVTSLSPQT